MGVWSWMANAYTENNTKYTLSGIIIDDSITAVSSDAFEFEAMYYSHIDRPI